MTDTSTTATLQTGHVGLNVTDLGRSLDFYRTIFGFEIAAHSEADGRGFALLTLDGQIVLTLWKQSSGTFPADRPGLHHLSFQVDSIDLVRAYEARVREAGGDILHDGIVPHGEGMDSGGLYFTDPDGIRLEVFSPSGAAVAAAPTPGAPTCGFF
ncbi:MAG TPA: VOC family protein [Methylomirabilota bacterium]|nr:VOC family protein [Methylomirabilota bacterium]